jgi:hypothetical protein
MSGFPAWREVAEKWVRRLAQASRLYALALQVGAALQNFSQLSLSRCCPLSFFSLVHTPDAVPAVFLCLGRRDYHRTDPNHRSIVSAIAVQTTLVTTRNTKPKPNIASARYSVPTVAPHTTNKAHATRPMRRMFTWKRRLARLQGGFGRDSIGETQITSSQYYILAEAICNGTGASRGDLSGCVRPRDSSPAVQRRTWEALANSGAFPLVK